MPFAAQHLKAARLHLQKADPVMKRILKKVGPCTLKTRRDRFGALVDSILSQQISTAAATTIKGRLRDSVAPDPVSPESLQSHTVESLRAIGVSRQKANYLLDLVEQTSSGNINLRNLGRKEDQAVIQHLVQVKGIGVWTAQMFLMFTLGRLDVFPSGDLGIQNAIVLAYEYSEKPAISELEKLAEKWSPYRTIASWYLWQYLDFESQPG